MSDQLRPYTANSLKFILTPSPASLQKFQVLWRHILCPRLLLLPSCRHISFFPSISSLVFIPLCSLLSNLRMKFSFSHVKKQLRLFFFFLVLAPILRTLSLSQVSYHRPFLNKDNSLPGPRPTVRKIGYFSFVLLPQEETEAQKLCGLMKVTCMLFSRARTWTASLWLKSSTLSVVFLFKKYLWDTSVSCLLTYLLSMCSVEGTILGIKSFKDE